MALEKMDSYFLFLALLLFEKLLSSRRCWSAVTILFVISFFLFRFFFFLFYFSMCTKWLNVWCILLFHVNSAFAAVNVFRIPRKYKIIAAVRQNEMHLYLNICAWLNRSYWKMHCWLKGIINMQLVAVGGYFSICYFHVG